ncbi:hypothetical protein [Pseudomonas sp.]|uniref:hypothetical protein n=1 Tax=Pseudomonas sp. TaxID=306 RepID=UPI003D129F9F
MKISSLPPMPAATRTDAAKPPVASAQEGTVRSEPAASFSAMKPTGASSMAKPLSAPGMSSGQLSALLQTSVKMMEIRNDTSLSEDARQRLLKPLEQANKSLVDIAELRAEQEEKEKILEASSADAQAILEAGQEIAESADSSAPTTTGEAADTPEAAAAGSASPTPDGASPVYSASPSSSSASAPGENVDTHA